VEKIQKDPALAAMTVQQEHQKSSSAPPDDEKAMRAVSSVEAQLVKPQLEAVLERLQQALLHLREPPAPEKPVEKPACAEFREVIAD
jgi:hypothetical protein